MVKAEIRLESLEKTFSRWKSNLLRSWNRGDSDRIVTFEDENEYWNAIASVFLHYHWPKAFERFPSFRTNEADPFLSESYDFFYSLTRNFPPKGVEGRYSGVEFERLLSILKPKAYWPWVYHACDVMGTVGKGGAPSSGEEIFSVVLGLALPMEHLAFLMAVPRSPCYLIVRDNTSVTFVYDGTENDRTIGEFSFGFMDSPDNRALVAGLKETLSTNPRNVRILIPDRYSMWSSMRSSYDTHGRFVWDNKGGLILTTADSSDSSERPSLPFTKRRTDVFMDIPMNTHWNPISVGKEKSRLKI